MATCGCQGNKWDMLWLCLVTLTFHGVICEPSKSSSKESKRGYGNPYVDNEVPRSELPEIDQCAMISQIQGTVIHILNTHYEYGKGIHMLHSIVEGLQNDISTLKVKIDQVESRIPSWHNATSRSYPTFDRFTSRGSKASSSLENLTWGLQNLSKMMDTQNIQYQSLEKKYVNLRRKLKKTTTDIMRYKGKGEESVDAGLLEHYMGKQTDINSKLLHRIQALERGIKLQGDSPYVKSNTGGCPSPFIRHYSSCYYFSNNTANWIDGEKSCQRIHPKAHLVSIESREEGEFLVQYRIHNQEKWSSNYIWCGANDMMEEKTWRWVGTSQELRYNNWRPGQPDNHNNDQHCVYMRADGKDARWDDWHCYAAKLNSVCEINMRA